MALARDLYGQLEDTQRTGHNALIDFNNGACRKLYFPFALTLSGCSDTVNQKVRCYVYTPGLPSAEQPAHDGGCFCNRVVFNKDCFYMQCTGCGRFCHVDCALPQTSEMTEDELDRRVKGIESSYRCVRCQPSKPRPAAKRARTG